MAIQRLINLLPLATGRQFELCPLQRLLLRDGEYNADTVNNFDLIRRRSRRAEKRDRPEMRNKMGIPHKEPSAKAKVLRVVRDHP